MKDSTQSTYFFSSKENCANPWKDCEGTDIVLYIMKESNRLPICRSCWKKIADQDIGWSED